VGTHLAHRPNAIPIPSFLLGKGKVKTGNAAKAEGLQFISENLDTLGIWRFELFAHEYLEVP